VIGLDTNVIVRHLTDDDPVHSPAAHGVFEGLSPHEPGFIALIALVETSWVLRRAYRYSQPEVHHALRGLLGAADLVVESGAKALDALTAAEEHGSDFADALIALTGLSHGCQHTLTFDRPAQSLPGMSPVPG
jgi:predicted nucleic-acid-binding protein